MGCGSCGTSKDGAPGGCQSHGSCSSGGCNRMNVHDWLANLPFSDPESGCRIVEISFNNGSRKDYFKNTTTHFFEKGDLVAFGRPFIGNPDLVDKLKNHKALTLPKMDLLYTPGAEGYADY